MFRTRTPINTNSIIIDLKGPLNFEILTARCHNESTNAVLCHFPLHTFAVVCDYTNRLIKHHHLDPDITAGNTQVAVFGRRTCLGMINDQFVKTT